MPYSERKKLLKYGEGGEGAYPLMPSPISTQTVKVKTMTMSAPDGENPGYACGARTRG